MAISWRALSLPQKHQLDAAPSRGDARVCRVRTCCRVNVNEHRCRNAKGSPKGPFIINSDEVGLGNSLQRASLCLVHIDTHSAKNRSGRIAPVAQTDRSNMYDSPVPDFQRPQCTLL
ncbi:hypothetical protein NDU88_010634 [Pleurodeles waltl]|uniref:Uncharacterized protein n=1 Tax=Pleurodeles waltl TaxID=8319 RepID=A0AAV7PVR0_PLEWA|nr:hypothetical protein NDU88_010634 [Pleurodeles waltl]